MSTKAKSASARGRRIVNDRAPTCHSRNADFIHRGWRSPAITTLVANELLLGVADGLVTCLTAQSSTPAAAEVDFGPTPASPSDQTE